MQASISFAADLWLSLHVAQRRAAIQNTSYMEAEVKQVIKEKEYVHGEDRKEYASKGVGNAALTRLLRLTRS